MQLKHLRRRTAAVAMAALAALCAAAPAQAADGPYAPGSPDYNAAQQVLGSSRVHDTVSRFLTAAEQRRAPAGADGGTALAPAGAAPAPAKAPDFRLRGPVPLFELSPEFVAGKARPTTGQALRLSYLASRVSASDGHQAAVLLAQQGGAHNWQLAGIQDGAGEVAFAEQGTASAHTFIEPQIHAWYRLTASGSVEPLNKEAADGLHGKRQVSLAAYQQLVNKRYGDKLPGSRYDRKGYTGGYALTGDDRPAQAAGTTAAPASWRPAAYGAAALMTAGTAGALLRRRRRPAARQG
ncbi:hypothetical protein ACIHFE_21095 [Streptomyces sp. NPDC052396]|uniref:hypothetical protein n=1 Tax=Streptomyces sp. NPDC052396 TaxID=3365689 RepID=UPI0037D852FC